MTAEEIALIQLDYSAWMQEEAKKMNCEFNEIGLVVRRYENRIQAFKKRILKNLYNKEK